MLDIGTTTITERGLCNLSTTKRFKKTLSSRMIKKGVCFYGILEIKHDIKLSLALSIHREKQSLSSMNLLILLVK